MSMKSKASKTVDRDYRNALQFTEDDRSPSAEAYRMLRTSLSLGMATGDGSPECYLFTSAGPTEGKSVTCANLALAYARAGKRVALLDADLRAPALQKIFGTGEPASPHWNFDSSDEASKALSEMRVEVSDNLTLYPAPATPVKNPSELLGSSRFRSFLDRIRDENDIVLVDSPPAGLVTDAAVLVPFVDGVIFVIDYQLNNRRLVDKALRQLRAAGANICGVVLNRYDGSSAESYDTYYGGYGT